MEIPRKFISGLCYASVVWWWGFTLAMQPTCVEGGKSQKHIKHTVSQLNWCQNSHPFIII